MRILKIILGNLKLLWKKDSECNIILMNRVGNARNLVDSSAFHNFLGGSGGLSNTEKIVIIVGNESASYSY